jgi:hypothetical protein
MILEKNSFGYYELEFDKTKMFMMGSDQSYAFQSAAFTSFSFALNVQKIAKEVIEECRRNYTC